MLFVNGKEADKLTEEDIIALINNDDYMENQYIDYKQQFAFWDERLPRENRKQEVIEFKKDVCSFANAEGGYIFVGISEKNGLPNEIIGVEIKDKDKYELDIREKLSNIMGKSVPHFMNSEKNTICHLTNYVPFYMILHLNT